MLTSALCLCTLPLHFAFALCLCTLPVHFACALCFCFLSHTSNQYIHACDTLLCFARHFAFSTLCCIPLLCAHYVLFAA